MGGMTRADFSRILRLVMMVGAVCATVSSAHAGAEAPGSGVGDARVMTALRNAGWLYLSEAKSFTPEEVRRLDRWARVSWWGDEPTMPADGPRLGLGLEPTGLVRMVLPLSGAEKAGMRRGQKVTHYSVSSASGPWVDVASWPEGAEKPPAVWMRMEAGGVRKIERTPWARPGLIDRGSQLQIFWFDRDAVNEFEAAARNPRRAVRVLDLRGSPGGYTEAAEMFLGLFLGAGQVLGSYEFRDALGRKRERPWLTSADARRVLNPRDWRVLVDDRTASSAELVAETLARWGAEVVGGPTLGKHEVIETSTCADATWIACTVGRYIPKRGWP